MITASQIFSEKEQWKNASLTFLSTRRYCQLFGWEFGPTLFEHLNAKKEGPSAILLRKGLAVTWIGTPVAALIGLVAKRKPFFIVTSSLATLWLGIFTTVTIDRKTTPKQHVPERISLDTFNKLRERLGDLPQYWWWPWSQRIKYLKISPKEKERDQNDSNLSSQSHFAQITIHKIYFQRSHFFNQNQQISHEVKIDKCNNVEPASHANSIIKINKKRINITQGSKEEALASIELIPISCKHISITRSKC